MSEELTFFSKRLEDLSQDELELSNLLEVFFAKVAELPMIEQVKILKDFQGFLAEQREKEIINEWNVL